MLFRVTAFFVLKHFKCGVIYIVTENYMNQGIQAAIETMNIISGHFNIVDQLARRKMVAVMSWEDLAKIYAKKSIYCWKKR